MNVGSAPLASACLLALNSTAARTAEQEMMDANEPFPIYRIRTLGDPILNTPCTPIERIEDMPAGLLEAMKRICTTSHFRLPPGLGIAANQVGSLAAVCIVDRGRREFITMVNPCILGGSKATTWKQEGCLSVPGFFTSKKRHDSVMVRFRDEQWVEHTMTLSGLAAQVVQHEVDHLAGITITDGLTRQQRRLAEREVARAVARG